MIKWTFPEIENPPSGLVKPFGGFKSGDAARCIDELFYVPGAFGLVVYLWFCRSQSDISQYNYQPRQLVNSRGKQLLFVLLG